MMRAGKGIDIEGAENRTGVALPQEMPSWPVHQSTKPPDSQEPTIKPQEAKIFLAASKCISVTQVLQNFYLFFVKNTLQWLEMSSVTLYKCAPTKTGVPKSFTQTFNQSHIIQAWTTPVSFLVSQLWPTMIRFNSYKRHVHLTFHLMQQ